MADVTTITYPHGERVTVAFGTLPDPRDERIAELEAALLWIMQYAANQRIHALDRCLSIRSHAQLALVEMSYPERDMRATVEELEA